MRNTLLIVILFIFFLVGSVGCTNQSTTGMKKTVDVGTALELKQALNDNNVKTINLSRNITTSDSITLKHNDVTLNGNNFTLTISPKLNNDPKLSDEERDDYNTPIIANFIAITVYGERVTIKNIAIITSLGESSISISKGNDFTLKDSIIASTTWSGIRIEEPQIMGTTITNVQFKNMLRPIQTYSSVSLTNISFENCDPNDFAPNNVELYPIHFQGTKKNPIVITINGAFHHTITDPIALGAYGTIVTGNTSVHTFKKIDEFLESDSSKTPISIWGITDKSDTLATESVTVNSEKELLVALAKKSVRKIILNRSITISTIVETTRNGIEIDGQGYSIISTPNKNKGEDVLRVAFYINSENVTIKNIIYDNTIVSIHRSGFKLQDSTIKNINQGIRFDTLPKLKNLILERVTFDQVFNCIYTTNDLTLIDMTFKNTYSLPPITVAGSSEKPITITVKGTFNYKDEKDIGAASGYYGTIVTDKQLKYKFIKTEELISVDGENEGLFSTWRIGKKDAQPEKDITVTNDSKHTNDRNSIRIPPFWISIAVLAIIVILRIRNRKQEE